MAPPGPRGDAAACGVNCRLVRTAVVRLPDRKQDVVRILERSGKAAIAFSGGADSSLLLRLALDTLGAERVLVLTARSCLLKPAELDRAATWFKRHAILDPPVHEFVDIHPLDWSDFVSNPAYRCYLCKSRIYSIFRNISRTRGFAILADGTNADDMNSDRPGLRAISELDIETPLAAAGMTKEEVRTLSRELGLDTWEQPSASCLATRIPTGLEITPERLQRIAAMEKFLEEAGFFGCRARLVPEDPGCVHIQVRQEDLPRITAGAGRDYLIEFPESLKIGKVYVDPAGR